MIARWEKPHLRCQSTTSLVIGRMGKWQVGMEGEAGNQENQKMTLADVAD